MEKSEGTFCLIQYIWRQCLVFLSERPVLIRNEGFLVKASCITMDTILKVIKYCDSKKKKGGEMRKANIENKI